MSKDDVPVEMRDAQQSTVRDRIDKLHALLMDALDIEARIVGHSPAAEDEARKLSDYAIDAMESGLDGALERASDIVSQLKRIERRLG